MPDPVDHTYMLLEWGARYGKTMLMWQELMVRGLFALDDEDRETFDVLLVRPEQYGNVRITFRKEAPPALPPVDAEREQRMLNFLAMTDKPDAPQALSEGTSYDRQPYSPTGTCCRPNCSCSLRHAPQS